MTDMPDKAMLWHSRPPFTYVGTWATVRYPEEAEEYVKVAALPDMVPTWQPIETITPDAGHCLFYGDTRHDNNVAFSGWVATNGRFYADGGNLCKPTLWMPLPAAPAMGLGTDGSET